MTPTISMRKTARDLHAALDQAQDEIDRGEGIPAANEVIAELRKRAR
jgi:hypothetical protein